MNVDILYNSIQQLKINNADGLDLINVYIEDIEPGKGKIIIECYGEVWSRYWNATGSKTVKEFFLHCDDDYLLEKLSIKNTNRAYYIRIIKTVKKALKLTLKEKQ